MAHGGEGHSGEPDPAFFRDLERRRTRSLVEVDLDVAWSLHAADYQLVTPGGVTYTRDQYLGGIGSGALRYEMFEAASEVAVQVLGSDAAAVRYVARLVVTFPGGRDDTRAWHTDIYARRAGEWQVVWSQATEIPRLTTRGGEPQGGGPSASGDPAASHGRLRPR